MKKQEDQSSRTMRELAKLQGNKKEYVIWNLSSELKLKVQEKYLVEDYLYEIRTKQLKDIRSIDNAMLKEQHFACKQNKRSIVRRLNQKDKDEFSKKGVRFRPVKFKIYLQA